MILLLTKRKPCSGTVREDRFTPSQKGNPGFVLAPNTRQFSFRPPLTPKSHRHLSSSELGALLDKFFAVCDWWRKPVCDEKLSQMEGNGRRFRHLELSKGVFSYVNFLTVWGLRIVTHSGRLTVKKYGCWVVTFRTGYTFLGFLFVEETSIFLKKTHIYYLKICLSPTTLKYLSFVKKLIFFRI